MDLVLPREAVSCFGPGGPPLSPGLGFRNPPAPTPLRASTPNADAPITTECTVKKKISKTSCMIISVVVIWHGRARSVETQRISPSWIRL